MSFLEWKISWLRLHIKSMCISKLAKRCLALSAIGALLASGMGTAEAANKSKLSVYQHGKPVSEMPCSTPLPLQTAVLMGGGKDVASAFTWMIDAMRNCNGSPNSVTGQPGNFVVLRAGGNPAYDSYITKQGPVASVITLVIPDKASANDPALVQYLQNAGALWLTGGDQGDYYNFWQGTLLEQLIVRQVSSQHIPIGGTSAGMMILSQFAYTADPYSVTSAQALSDPYLPGYMTLKSDFWIGTPSGTPFPPLAGTVTDSHFDTRNRMGRLVTFLARVIQDGWVSAKSAKAIGVDEQTALTMTYDPASPSSWTGSVLANPDIDGAAYVLSVGPHPNMTVTFGTPLTFNPVSVQKYSATGSSTNYQIDVDNGTLSPTNPY